MIKSIQHKGLRLLWTRNDPSKLPPTHVVKIRNLLTYLNKATIITDMNLPGTDLHPLKGNFKGYWSVTVTANYRLIFEFKDGDAYLVDYLDYH